MFRYILAGALLIHAICGLTPNTRVTTFRPANFVNGVAPSSAATAFVLLRMASEDEGTERKISKDGTFYDDEVSGDDGWKVCACQWATVLR
jgi:hypothetical protein